MTHGAFVRVVLIAVVCVGCAREPDEPLPADSGAPFAQANPSGPEFRRLRGELGYVADAARVSVRGAHVTVSAVGESARALGITTASIGGCVRVAAPSGEPELSADARSVVIARGEVDELLVSRDDGVEQRWRFAARPSGGGPIEVKVDVEGMDFLADGPDGLLFGKGEDRIRYGHATWVDAAGVRVAVPARWEGTRIALTVPESVVTTATYPAVLDPLVGPARYVLQPTPVPNPQYLHTLSTIATNGANHLALYAYGSGTLDQTYKAVVLGPDASAVVPPKVLTGIDYCDAGQMYWSGTSYHFVCGGNFHELSTDGTLVTTHKYRAGLGTQWEVAAGVSARGANGYLLVWTAATNVVGVRLDASGALLDTVPFAIANASGSQSAPSVTWIGDRYLVAYEDARNVDVATIDLRATTVEENGQVADANGTLLYGELGVDERAPTVVSGPNGTMLFFELQSRLRATSLDASSAPVGPLRDLGAWSFGGLQVAPRGDGWWVTIRGITAAIGFVLSADGSIVTEVALPTPHSPYGEQTPADVVFNATRGFMLVKEHVRPRGGGIYSLLFAIELPTTGSAAPLRRIVDATTTPDYHSSLAGNSSGFVALVYSETGIRAVPVGPDGRPGTPSPILEVPSTSFTESPVRIAVGGAGGFLGFAAFGGNLVRLPFGETGTPSGTSVRSYTGRTAPRTAFAGGEYFAVFESGTKVYADRFSPTGVQTSTGAIAISAANSTQVEPDVAASAGTHLVVWNDSRDSASAGTNVYGFRMTSTGAPITGTALAIGTDAGNDRYPAVVSTGAGWLVAWWNRGGYVRARAVAQDGTLGAPSATIATGVPFWEEYGLRPAIAWGGTRALVVWMDSDGSTIRGATLDATGTLVEGPFVLDFVVNGFVGGVASVGGNSFAVLYEAYDPTYSTTRSFVRSFSITTPLGTVCQVDGDCGGNPCVDGVCCASACTGGTADCQACSVAAGGRFDGVCSPRVAATVCRDAVGVCDQADACDGASRVCPEDAAQSEGTTCDVTSAGPCDAPDVCVGTLGATATCAPRLSDAGTPCRPIVSDCDAIEVCAGDSAACPADVAVAEGTPCGSAPSSICDAQDTCAGTLGASATCTARFAASGTPCRDATGSCDVVDVCTGDDAVCPVDAHADDGTICDDGLVCSATSQCSDGACTAATALGCDDGDACTTDVCGEPGGCSHQPHTMGTCAPADAGTPDAGTSGEDAGADLDAGTEVDASTGPRPRKGSCAAVPGEEASPVWPALAGLMVAVQVGRRRRRRTGSEV